jgi:hypothetical protein
MRQSDVRRRIGKHATAIKPGQGEDAQFEHDLRAARHQAADKKVVEEARFDKSNDAFTSTVGGVPQKIEVYPVDSRAVVEPIRNLV